MWVLLQLHLHSLLITWLHRLGKDKCMTRRESFQVLELIRLTLEILRYVTLVGYVLYDVNCKCCLSINMED